MSNQYKNVFSPQALEEANTKISLSGTETLEEQARIKFLEACIAKGDMDYNPNLKEKPAVFSQEVDGVVRTVFTSGEVSLIKGKPKSKKSFFCNMVSTTLLSEGLVYGQFRANLPEGKKGVVYFDTEQGDKHLNNALWRIHQSFGKKPNNFTYISMREYTPEDRTEIIERYLSTRKDVGFVIIDGIKDLIYSINSEQEAVDITTKLLAWSKVNDLHIINVLHENKGDNNARGHLGTELLNKSETVIEIKAEGIDGVNSQVIPRQTRDIPFVGFTFTIDSGMPVVCDNPSKRGKKTELSSEDEDKILADLFKDRDVIKYKGDGKATNYNYLREEVQKSHTRVKGSELKQNRATKLTSKFKSEGKIEKISNKEGYRLLIQVEAEVEDVDTIVDEDLMPF